MPVRKCRFLIAAFGLAAIFIVFLTFEQPRRPAPRYTVTDLGVLPGYTQSAATAINSRGDVLVSNFGLGPYPEHACLYQDGKLHDLGTLPGGGLIDAHGINAEGEVTGIAMIGSGQHAFLYKNGKMQDLGSLPGFPNSLGIAINDAGEIAGDIADFAGQTHVFLYRQGKMSDLGTPPGCSENHAGSINAAGDIFGFCRKMTSRSSMNQPFSYDSRTGKTTVMALPAPYLSCEVFRGNDRGQSVGDVRTPNLFHAALWNGNQITDLGGLPGFDNSSGKGLNNRGEAVGYCFRVDKLYVIRHFLHNFLHLPERETECAFVYENGKMEDLNELIPGDADWTLEAARAINDAGQIVGMGLHHGQMRAFLLTPVR